MSRGRTKASACPLRAIVCLALYSVRSCPSRICPGHISLVSGPLCRLFLSYGLQVVTCQDHFIVLTLMNMYQIFVLSISLKQMLFLLSLYVMLSIGLLLVILACVVGSLRCACLVNVYVPGPYVRAGCTYKLYTCLFRHNVRLLMKRSQ